MKIIRVPPKEVPSVYQQAVGYLSKALEFGHGESTLDTIYNNCLNDHMQLWFICDDGYSIVGAFITEVRIYATNKTVVVPYLSGKDMETWVDDVDRIVVGFCKENGAKYLEVIGRKGWERQLSGKNYKHTYVCLHKEV